MVKTISSKFPFFSVEIEQDVVILAIILQVLP